MGVLVLRNSGTSGSLLAVLVGRVDKTTAASGASSPPGAPSLIASMRTKAATYPSMSIRRRSLLLATASPQPLSIYCIRPTIKAEKAA